MAQFLYVNPDPKTQSRATQLGCGWVQFVPPQFTNIATAPCVIINGVGQQVVLPDDGTLTATQVASSAAPILTAEQTALNQNLVLQTNQATIQQHIDAGITALQTWVANNPNGATLTAAQTAALVKVVVGLAKLARQSFTDTTGA